MNPTAMITIYKYCIIYIKPRKCVQYICPAGSSAKSKSPPYLQCQVEHLILQMYHKTTRRHSQNRTFALTLVESPSFLNVNRVTLSVRLTNLLSTTIFRLFYFISNIRHNKIGYYTFTIFVKTAMMDSSIERIEDFCNPNPVQYFHCLIQSDPNPAVLRKCYNPVYIRKTSD